jgi:hypothetical protein
MVNVRLACVEHAVGTKSAGGERLGPRSRRGTARLSGRERGVDGGAQ